MVLPCLDQSTMMRTERLMKNKHVSGQMCCAHWDLNTTHPDTTRRYIYQNAIILTIGMMTRQKIKELFIETMISEQGFSTFWTMILWICNKCLVLIQKSTHFIEHTIGFIFQTNGQKIDKIGILLCKSGCWYIRHTHINQQRGLYIIEIILL